MTIAKLAGKFSIYIMYIMTILLLAFLFLLRRRFLACWCCPFESYDYERIIAFFFKSIIIIIHTTYTIQTAAYTRTHIDDGMFQYIFYILAFATVSPVSVARRRRTHIICFIVYTLYGKCTILLFVYTVFIHTWMQFVQTRR